MNLTKEQIEFQKKSETMIGLKLSRVEYLEIDYSPEYPNPSYKTKFEEIDSLDFSIILHFENRFKVEICWDPEFYSYGIGLKLNTESELSNCRNWDVTGSELWKKFIGEVVQRTDIVWSWVSRTGENKGKVDYFIYPETIKLQFSNGRNIFISAANFIDEGGDKVEGLMDNLLVTDNEKLAKQVNMLA